MKQKLSLLLYQLLMLILLPIILVILFVRSISQKQYRDRILERLGLLQTMNNGGIVIHGASVGEIIALKPFVEKLLLEFPDKTVTLTCFTPTGSAQIKKTFGDKVQHCYLPLDNPLTVALFLNKLKPSVLVLMETELWPSLISQAKARGSKLLLINARLSANSLNKYQKLTSLVTPALNAFDLILAQSEDNAERFKQLGANVITLQVSGNLKYDIEISAQTQSLIEQLTNNVKGKRIIWVVGSSHTQDESLIINCYQQLKLNHPELLLVIVPRHPERFEKIADNCHQQKLVAVKRSEQAIVLESTDVWLVDTLGELLAFYAIANICTVAGSFNFEGIKSIGGHNPLEAALFAKPIIVGNNMANFTDICQQLLNANALIQLNNNSELVTVVTELIAKPEQCQQLGSNALDVVKANQGATDLSIASLKRLMNSSIQ